MPPNVGLGHNSGYIGLLIWEYIHSIYTTLKTSSRVTGIWLLTSVCKYFQVVEIQIYSNPGLGVGW